jgi:DNA-binding protein
MKLPKFKSKPISKIVNVINLEIIKEKFINKVHMKESPIKEF